jgi:hypothetical protein
MASVCLLTLVPEPCSHFVCSFYYTSLSLGRLPCINPETEEQMVELIGLQNRMLREIHRHNQLVRNSVESLAKQIEGMAKHISQEDGVEQERIQSLLTNGRLEQSCEYKITVDEALKEPIYKERGFSLSCALVGQDGNTARLPGAAIFVVNVYTADPVPKKLQQNISGKRILRGTTEAELDSTGHIMFPNIVINEVSSHYVGDCFSIVISHVGPYEIEPLIFYRVTVRARKPIKTR